MNDHFISKRQKLRSEILAALLIIQVISWVWVLANGMYSEKFFDFSQISSIVRDTTWYSSETTYRQVPLWGKHNFSDLQIFFGWNADPNPYFERIVIPPIPPFGLSYYALLNFWNPQVGFIVWLFSTIFFSALVTRLWLKTESPSSQATAYCALVLLNTSALMGIDRGNILLILMSIVGFLFFKVLNLQQLGRFDAFLLASAISLKPFLLLLLIFFIIERKYRFVFQTILIGLACNLVASAMYGGQPMRIVRSMISEQSKYNNSGTLEFSARWSSAAFRVLFEALRMFGGREFAISELTRFNLLIGLPGIVYLIFVIIICSRRDIPIWIRMISIMSTAQMVVAASPRYDLVWTCIGGLVILQQPPQSKISSESIISRKELVIAYSCAVGFLVGGLPFARDVAYSPLVWVLVVCLIFVTYAFPKRQRILKD